MMDKYFRALSLVPENFIDFHDGILVFFPVVPVFMGAGEHVNACLRLHEYTEYQQPIGIIIIFKYPRGQLPDFTGVQVRPFIQSRREINALPDIKHQGITEMLLERIDRRILGDFGFEESNRGIIGGGIRLMDFCQVSGK